MTQEIDEKENARTAILLRCCEKYQYNEQCAESLKQHIANLQAQLKGFTAENEKIKEYVATFSPTDWSYGEHEILWKTSKVLEITDEGLLPAEAFRIKSEPNKAYLKGLIEATGPIAGAEIVERRSVSVK